MRKFFIALLGLLGLAACDHRPLHDPVNTHYVRVYIDDQIKNVTTGYYNEDYLKPKVTMPKVMRIMLCDPETGETKSERFLTNVKTDSKGTYLDGYIACPAGKYQLLAYNWDTEVTQIREPENCFKATAYTSQALTKAESVHYAPDFLFVDESIVEFPNITKVDTLYDANRQYFSASSIVESYYFQVPVKNMEGVAEITAVVTGMAEDKKLINRNIGDAPVSMITSMSKGYVVADVTTVYATVNTFGHFPGAESSIHLIFYMTLVDGQSATIDIDISDKFDSPEAVDNNWIIIKDVYEAPKPKPGSGFKPGLDKWEDIDADIPI